VGVGVGAITIGIAVSYVLALISYRFVEAPFLTLKDRFHD
jgi:peptidoglycan/LPS O-acetylase OafA/YrhL